MRQVWVLWERKGGWNSVVRKWKVNGRMKWTVNVLFSLLVWNKMHLMLSSAESLSTLSFSDLRQKLILTLIPVLTQTPNINPTLKQLKFGNAIIFEWSVMLMSNVSWRKKRWLTFDLFYHLCISYVQNTATPLWHDKNGFQKPWKELTG